VTTALLGGSAAVWWGRRAFRLVVVSGDSMRPTLLAGDRLLVGPAGRLRVGDVVAVADPRLPSRLLVKRVRSVGLGSVEVGGDNERASTDSRHFGAVARSLVVGRVLYRYGPVGRAGWRP
jgi:nickel-type superoxide dismutase maturation protease